MSSSICKFYSLGQCSKGSKCPFIHDDSGICLYYQTGDCRFGAKCALKHIKLNKKSQSASCRKAIPSTKKGVLSREISDQLKYNDITKTNAEITNIDVVSTASTKQTPNVESCQIIPTESYVPLQDRNPLCPFKDYCRFDKECRYSHGLECNICGGKVLHPQGSIEEYQGNYFILQDRTFL